jgi:streptogrisin C
LPDWFAQASPEVLDLPGTVFADNDEAHGRLLFGVEHAGAINAVRNTLERLGIPSSAYAIQVTEPIYFASTLQQRWRPTQGGVQIHFGGYLCSLGFNADDGTERSFITASHCTNRQGGVEGTQYYQPTSSVDGTVIATEVEDPAYVRGRPGCSKSKVCRSSDASRALYSSTVASTRGAIAQTSGPNNGSLEVTGSFAVTSQDNTTTNFAVGTSINKVGRTTGWTQGNVTNSCVTTNVSGSKVQLLCQTFVQNPGGAVVVGGGDSGSNVFKINGGNAEMVGVLWGGNGNGTLFVFSPLKNVRDELGPIVATQ